jgi:uncharacterized protein (TIGR02145 family)
MKKIILFITGFIVLSLHDQAQTITDIEGNVYNMVTIGTQTWLKENLKTIKYNDGTSIPLVSKITDWAALTSAGTCTYNNTINVDTINTYGRLYNWYAVNTKKLCPLGWHIPSDEEWITLTDYLGGENIAGGKLKEICNTQWHTPNHGANNISGFSALPGGYCISKFYGIGYNGFWWSSNEYSSTFAWYRNMTYNDSTVSRVIGEKRAGLTVRCIMDNSLTVDEIKDNILIYPNPVKEKLFIKNIKSSNSKIYIYNSQGGLVLYKPNALNSIDISNLNNGFYIVKIIDSRKSIIIKLIKK